LTALQRTISYDLRHRNYNQAEQDIRGIYEYIAYVLMSAQNAAAQIERIKAGIFSLSEYPERQTIYDVQPWKSRNLRFLPIDNYTIYYLINDEKKSVQIIRVMYGKRDTTKQLNKDQ
jgi:plasmid stabilization system protein ParE